MAGGASYDTHPIEERQLGPMKTENHLYKIILVTGSEWAQYGGVTVPVTGG